MLVPSKQLLEEGTGSSQYHLMCFHLLTILAGQSDIGEVIVFSQVPESTFDVLLKVIPLEAELFRHVNAAVSQNRLNMNCMYA